MSRNLKILFVFAALFMMVVVTGLLVSYVSNSAQESQFPFGRSPQQVTFEDLAVITMARTVVTTINIALLLVLVITYASIYLKTRSEFTVGLLIFAFVFLMKDVVSSPLLLIGGLGFGLYGLGPLGAMAIWFVVLPDLFELVALALLLYLSVKY
jgi:hypothetical protein